jgi:hypothetical protein
MDAIPGSSICEILIHLSHTERGLHVSTVFHLCSFLPTALFSYVCLVLYLCWPTHGIYRYLLHQ